MILAVVQFVIVGIAAARWLEPSIPPRRLLGTAFLLGSGICAFVLLALSVLGIAWTTLSFTIAFCIVAIALWVPLLRRPSASAGPNLPWHPLDAGTLLLVVAHAAYTLKAGAREWDFWAIWGLKARVFFVHGGIDWAYLAHPDHTFAHPDYPLLLPLNFVQIALLRGDWLETGLGFLSTLYAIALLLIVRDWFAEESSSAAVAAVSALAVAGGAFSWPALADAPMIAFGGAGLLLIRRGSVRTGAVLLGLAAFTKNEGLALIVAAALALLVASRRRDIVRLWPAVVIAAPWTILRAMHALPNDLAEGDLGGRVMTAFTRVPELARALAGTPVRTPLLWIAIAIALIVSARRLHEERFLLAVVVLQLAFYFAVYLVSPHPIRNYVYSSWPRILPHVALPAAFAAVSLARRRA